MNVTVNVPDQTVNDMIISAFEGGCNYWVSQLRLFDNNGKRVTSLTDKPLENLSLIVVVEDEEGDYEEHDLRLSLCDARNDKIANGLNHMAKAYPKHFANVVSDDHDAETADVFIQCCIFSDLKYG